MRAHRDEALAENARFLADNGLHPDLIAKRLGINLDALEQILRRH